ncbi:MAG TPA: hypothetical protein PK095_17755, partial [Myxococcota bacterium]|nr:hypothetical protein [Myxococcota bacterium]
FPAAAPHTPQTLHTIVFETPPTASTPITERWWFWATLVGVTGLAVALGFALAPASESDASSGDLGITLELP